MEHDATTHVTEETAPGDNQGKSAALTRELSEFLLEFSIGVHRYAMYPPNHPSLIPASNNIIGRLSEIFLERESLAIGVAREQLVIEGVATESKHPVLRDLSKRLHEHQLAALTFKKGIMASEVEGILQTLAKDPEKEGEPIGLLPKNEIPEWPHARLFPLGYDQLGMKGEDEEDGSEMDRASHLWLGLARSAIASDDPEEVSSSTDAESVAGAIKTHNREDAYDQVIVGYLLQLADELKSGEGRESESVRKRVSSLIDELDQSTLERLVEMGGSVDQRRKFVLDANQSLAVDSVVKILDAAANASQQDISHSMTRLLSKLSMHASSGDGRMRDQADTALRDNVEELLDDWELEDPNPDEYTLVLDSMAQATPVFFHEEDEDEFSLSGAERLFQMSLEIEAWGPTVAKAVSDMIEAGEVSLLFELASASAEDNKAVIQLQDFVTNPKQLRRLLRGGDVDEATLWTLVQRMGEEAIPTLLDALTESDSRSVRRKVFDVLARIGEGVGEAVMARMDEPRWYVVRNMLALVHRLPEKPEGFSAGPFMAHEDPRVRREAFPMAISESLHRERALASGLADADERLLRMALLEVQESVPETLVPVLVNRVVQSERAQDLRAMGVRALQQSKSTLALETLLEVTSPGKSLLGRPKLAQPSLVVVAAISALSSAWRHDKRALALLKAAASSKDPEIKKAVKSTGGGK